MKQGVRWGSRVVTGLAALMLLTRCGGEPTSREGEDERCQEASGLERRELAFAPVADAYVEEGQEAHTLFGEERKLVADNLSRRSAYLRFEVPEPPGPVLGATLRLYALDGSLDGPALYLASTDWTEEGSMWTEAPRLMGGPLGDVGLVPNGSWVEYDVTAVVTGRGAYGFALRTESRNGVDFASKEHTRQEVRPRLVLTVEAPAESQCGPGR